MNLICLHLYWLATNDAEIHVIGYEDNENDEKKTLGLHTV